MHPQLTARVEHHRSLPVLVWSFAEPRLCISSGPLGGGIGARDWLVNATVPLDYDRTDPTATWSKSAPRWGSPAPDAGC